MAATAGLASVPRTSSSIGTGDGPSASQIAVRAASSRASSGGLGGGAPVVDDNGLASGAGLNPVDTDSDGTADTRDLDSDGDGINDIIEAGGTDADNDGQIDNFIDISPKDGLDDSLAASPLPLPDSDNNGIPDYRDNGDLDNDGITDTDDLDTDNDGIPDSIEGDASTDSDGDGIPDYRDLDSDNDGLFDLTESGISNSAGLDGDGDGRIDTANIVGSNGLADAVETTADSGTINYTVADSDGDGIDDYRDLDSDNDGIPDVTEGDRSDPDRSEERRVGKECRSRWSPYH